MKNESILIGIIGLLVGVGIAWATATLAVNNNNTGMMRMMGMNTNSSNSSGMMGSDDMSMEQMIGNLKGKAGDNFDKAFIEEMTAHHQGAIDMANLAKTSANHDEIKKMASDIITSQTKEVNKMKAWQVNWGISSSGSHDMME